MHLIAKGPAQHHDQENQARNEVKSVHAHQHVYERAGRVGIGSAKIRVARHQVAEAVVLAHQKG